MATNHASRLARKWVSSCSASADRSLRYDRAISAADAVSSGAVLLTAVARSTLEWARVNKDKTDFKSPTSQPTGDRYFIPPCAPPASVFSEADGVVKSQQQRDVQSIDNEATCTGTPRREPPTSCTYCGRFFDTTLLLNRHILSHLKPHQCLICNTSFARGAALKRHHVRHQSNYSLNSAGAETVPIASSRCANTGAKVDNDIASSECGRCEIKSRRHDVSCSELSRRPDNNCPDKAEPNHRIDEILLGETSAGTNQRSLLVFDNADDERTAEFGFTGTTLESLNQPASKGVSSLLETPEHIPIRQISSLGSTSGAVPAAEKDTRPLAFYIEEIGQPLEQNIKVLRKEVLDLTLTSSCEDVTSPVLNLQHQLDRLEFGQIPQKSSLYAGTRGPWLAQGSQSRITVQQSLSKDADCNSDSQPRSSDRATSSTNTHSLNNKLCEDNGITNNEGGEDGDGNRKRKRACHGEQNLDNKEPGRYLCPYHVREPQKYPDHRTRYVHISQLARHLKRSHSLSLCTRCVTILQDGSEVEDHERGPCIKSCTKNGSCKRHWPQWMNPPPKCVTCLLSSDDVYKAICHLLYPHEELSALEGAFSESSHQDRDMTEATFPFDFNDASQQLTEQAQMFKDMDKRRTSFDTLPSNWSQELSFFDNPFIDSLSTANLQDQDRNQSVQEPTRPDSAYHDFNFARASTAEHEPPGAAPHSHLQPSISTSTLPHSLDREVQELREQVALLKQRCQQPGRAELEKHAMARLLWERLVYIGDLAVQPGQHLWTIAEKLAPDIITDDKAATHQQDTVPVANVDWNSAGLGPQDLAIGKGKQRTAGEMADSAYSSGVR